MLCCMYRLVPPGHDKGYELALECIVCEYIETDLQRVSSIELMKKYILFCTKNGGCLAIAVRLNHFPQCSAVQSFDLRVTW